MQVIERGADPIAIVHRSLLKLGLYVMAALLAGIFLAVALARLSRRVLDEQEIAEIVGQPVLAQLPRSLGTDADGSQRFEVPVDAEPLLDELSTSIESSRRPGHSLTVLVVSTEYIAHSSSLARSTACLFERWGLNVAYVDADPRSTGRVHGDIRSRMTMSDVIARRAAIGPRPFETPVPPPVAEGAEQPGIEPVPTAFRGPGPGLPSDQRRLTFIDMSTSADAVTLRRNGPENVISLLTEGQDVAVVWAGSLLENPNATQLVSSVDAVVLVVPVRFQERRRLRTIVQQLGDFQGALLVVSDMQARSRKSDATRARDDEDFRDELPPPSPGGVVARRISVGGSG